MVNIAIKFNKIFNKLKKINFKELKFKGVQI